MADDVKVKISVDDNQAVQAFSRLEKSANDFTSNFAKGIGLSDRAFDVFKGNIAANVVAGAFNLMRDAAKEFFNVIVVEGVTSSINYEDKLQGLNVALRNSGEFTKQLSADFEELAKSTQQTTKFSDSMVLSAATQLQTLARLSGDGLQRATKDSIDLAAALRIDLTSAAELVAKAHEGQTMALRRQGIVISETISPTEKYAALLGIIETRFGGSAVAQATTYAARIEILKNQFDDVQKSVGNYIIKNSAITSVLKVATESLVSFEEALISNKDNVRAFVTDGVLFIIDSLGALVSTFDVVSRIVTPFVDVFLIAFNGLSAGINTILAAISGSIGLFGQGLYDIFGDYLPKGFKTASDSFVNFSSDMLDTLDPLGENIKSSWKGTVDAFDSDTKTKLGSAADFIKDFSDKVKTSINETKNLKPEADQAGGSTGLSEAQLAAIRDANIFEAELKKIKDESLAEQEVAEAQHNIAIGQGRTDDLAAIFNYENQKIEINRTAALTIAENQTTDVKKNQAIKKANAEADKALIIASNKFESDMDKNRIASRASTLSTIATLSSSNNNTLATIGKAAGIAQIAIDTPQAISKALAAFPPPFNFVAAALVGAAEAAQASAIAGVKFETGGFVPGLGQYGDQVQARLNPSEVVLNTNQQKEFMDVANGRSSGGNSNVLSALVDAIRNQVITVQVDGREIARSVREQRLAGFAI